MSEIRRTVPVWLGLGGAIALLVGVRLLSFGSVFRSGDVVLLSNDPYAYLHIVEHALDSRPTTSSAIGEPFLVWTLIALSTLAGGSAQAAFVLAWYPVLSAVVSGVLVYRLATVVTEDVRVGLVAVLLLAVTPLHAFRSALGFADHHAFDYAWLVLTATAFTWLVVRTDADRSRRWAVGAVLGLAIAGQTLAWEGSPVLLLPTGGALVASLLVIVRTETAVRTLTPAVAGFGLAAVIVQLVHSTVGWQTAFVAATPVMLFLGGALTLAVTAAVARSNRSWPSLIAVGTVSAVLILALVWLLVPAFLDTVLEQLHAFETYFRSLSDTGIGETKSITSAFGPVAGPIIFLGFSPFLGLPAAAWGVYRGWRHREPQWLVLGVYVVWFLGLSFLQRRFAVYLGLFLAVFGAVGFLALAHWLDLTDPPMPAREPDVETAPRTLAVPERERLAILAGLGVVGLGSGALYTRRVLSQLAIADATYNAARWMRRYAADRGWDYPRNYVLAEWDDARVYNYFVNGESRSYSYARANYEDFIFSSDSNQWYTQFQGRVGFVVTRPIDNVFGAQLQSRLHDHYGSATGTTGGVGHFRAVWESQSGSRKVFTLVPGATVSGTAAPATTVSVSTRVTLAGSGRTITYRRRAETDEEGAFSVVVAHPGTYQVGEDDETITIDETAVQNGEERSITR